VGLDELDAEPSEDAGRELAARMLAAGAGDLLARAAASPPSTDGPSA
jgi:hypothetical protein